MFTLGLLDVLCKKKNYFLKIDGNQTKKAAILFGNKSNWLGSTGKMATGSVLAIEDLFVSAKENDKWFLMPLLMFVG